MTNQKNIALIDKAPNRTNYHNHFKDSFEFDHIISVQNLKRKSHQENSSLNLLLFWEII